MSFTGAFLRTLPRHPIRALAALYWAATGRRQRARNRLRLAAEQSRGAYRRWIATAERAGDLAAAAPRLMRGWPATPRLSVIFYLAESTRQRDLARGLAALEALVYPDWELVLVTAPGAPPPPPIAAARLTLAPACAASIDEALAIGLAAATGDHVLPLAEGMLLAPTALYRFAEALAAAPAAAILYGDHDRVDRRGRRSAPWFKPGWDTEMLLAQDYVSPVCLLAAAAARAAAPASPGLYALLLALAGAGARGVHVPHILAHRAHPPPDTGEARRLAVERHLAGSGARVGPGPHGTLAVAWPLPAPLPLISIIVPTRDQPGLLRRCIAGVLAGTQYPALELILVDNGSRQQAALALLDEAAKDPRVRVLRHDAPFNFSALCNLGARAARGDYLCLLNNDTEVVEPLWLIALLRQAARGDVGAVGARLLYPDGTIQHAGVVVGLGGAAGHPHRFQRSAAAGYFAQTHIAREVSAVTAACLLVARAKYERVGGFDEAGLAVAFNDVDFCLKLRAAGFRNLYEPAATLIHHESKSRGRDALPANRARYGAELALLQARWGTADHADPFYPPALDRASEACLIRLPD